MRKLIAGLFAAAALVGPTLAPPVVAASTPVAIAAKSCSGGYTRAVINGSQKCLRRGQYCARSADSQYKRYGFRCTKRDSNGATT